MHRLFSIMLCLVFLLVPLSSPLEAKVSGSATPLPVASGLTGLYVEAGFPVRVNVPSGSFTTWPESPGTAVGNFDDDPQLEIAYGAYTNSSLYVWNSDSSLLYGWPPKDNHFITYASAGNLSGFGTTQEVVGRYDDSFTFAYDSQGHVLPGWSVVDTSWGHFAPALADIDGDGYDEVLSDKGDRKLYAFWRDGSLQPGFPVTGCTPSQWLHTPAVGDITGDGHPEIVTSDDSINGLNHLCALSSSGAILPGFPVTFSGYASNFPVIGDVDGDGVNEIVQIEVGRVALYNASATLENAFAVDGLNIYGTHLALGNIDADPQPEILFAGSADPYGMGNGNGRVFAYNSNGSPVPGWPVDMPLPERLIFGASSLPLIGDITGDNLPEVISSIGDTYAFNRNGKMLPQFPLPGTPQALADIDLDGRNEIIVAGVSSATSLDFTRTIDEITVYDLGGPKHGKVEWGQFNGGSAHRGVYPVPPVSSPNNLPVSGYLAGNGYLAFLPIVYRGETQTQTQSLINGRVRYHGVTEAGVPLNLRLYDGSQWKTIASTTSQIDGKYTFTNVPALTNGQSYIVQYQNHAKGHLAAYVSRKVINFRAGTQMAFSDIELADYELLSPTDNAALPLPVSFITQDRATGIGERYNLVLIDPQTNSQWISSVPLDNATALLTSLPPGISAGKLYLWTTYLISPDGSVSLPTSARAISFTTTTAGYSPLLHEEILSFQPFPSYFPCPFAACGSK